MHEMYMRMALAEAQQALEEEEVPVGAVISHDGRVIARAHDQREQLRDPTAHAEMIAITQAAESLGSWRLRGLHAVRDARTLSDVRGGDFAGADRVGGLWSGRSQGRRRADALSSFSAIRG